MSNLQRIGSSPPPPPPERTRFLVRGTIAPVFIDAHALSPVDAIAFTPAEAREGKQFAAMLRDGSIKRLSNGRYYFDMAAYEAAAAARTRKLVPIVFLIAVVIAIVLVLSYNQGTLSPR